MARDKYMRRILLLLPVCCLMAACSSTPKTTATAYTGQRPLLVNGRAIAPEGVPDAVKKAIAAGNAIQHMPYVFGGGHGKPSHGLDCSGSTSYVLRSAGLMQGCIPSQAFLKWGNHGPGKYITVYARDGHVFMTVCGLRLDTSSGGSGHVGPRWNTKPRSLDRFKARHPAGL